MSESNSTSSLMMASVPLKLKFGDTLGAAFIGLLVAAVLFGIMNVQYIYFQRFYKHDPKYVKFTIIFL
ncbi:hypothetical protein PNOK_0151900 [Pyrrhoderma noxium]|uniref:Uncharacterized protein n=1 Tax=Pyrrhoderma noxium TaxID=2282107 RepID=A0A286UPQ6_9AGAM|nr:hypothetical protein PNOK_0151900 [Pyrrhoderma noxium]